MKNYFFIFLFFSISMTAQDNFWTLGVGNSGTTRIIYFPDDNLSSIEKSETLNLNSTKGSFHIEIGYVFGKSSNISWRLGSSFNLMRFGLRKYKFPLGFHNSTPQYPLIKRVVVQNQIRIFLEPTFKKSILWSRSFFVKSAFVWNYKDYKLKISSYDSFGERAFYGNSHAENFNLHLFDLNIGFGLNYSLLKERINLQPYSSMFLHPYKVRGLNYIYFEKDTYGILWDFGLIVQYRFSLN